MAARTVQAEPAVMGDTWASFSASVLLNKFMRQNLGADAQQHAEGVAGGSRELRQ